MLNLIRYKGVPSPIIECDRCGMAIDGRLYDVDGEDICEKCLLEEFDAGDAYDVAEKRYEQELMYAGVEY